MALSSAQPQRDVVLGEKIPRHRSSARGVKKRWMLLVLASFVFVVSTYFFLGRSGHDENAAGHGAVQQQAGSSSSSHDNYHSPDSHVDNGIIPNQVNFVFALNDPSSDLPISFRQYLAVYAAWYHWKPDRILLHTNADEVALDRARRGEAGKWARALLEVPGVEVKQSSMPTHAGNGVELTGMEHRSDFMRVRALLENGGIYIDFDVVAVRDIRPLRRSGFGAVVGLQEGPRQLNSGTFMAAPGAALTASWLRLMHHVYDGGWTTHSNEALTAAATRLMRERPGAVLVMEREAFAPEGWFASQSTVLFAVHNETRSALEGLDLRSGPAEPPEFVEGAAEPGGTPGWARDWSASYLLHAFHPSRNGGQVEGFTEVTPGYVLNRQSNYARVAYPVVRDMFLRGLVSVDDFDQE